MNTLFMLGFVIWMFFFLVLGIGLGSRGRYGLAALAFLLGGPICWFLSGILGAILLAVWISDQL